MIGFVFDVQRTRPPLSRPQPCVRIRRWFTTNSLPSTVGLQPPVYHTEKTRHRDRIYRNEKINRCQNKLVCFQRFLNFILLWKTSSRSIALFNMRPVKVSE